MTTEADIERLIEQLADTRTRAQARRELAQLGREAAPKLLPVLDESRALPNKRWAAISLLGGCGYEPAVPVLLKVMRGEPSLCGEAYRALKAITGKDLGDDIAAWEVALGGAAGVADEGAVTQEPTGASPACVALELVQRAVADLATSIEWREPDTACVAISAAKVRECRLVVTFGQLNRSRQPVVSIHTDCGPSNPTVQAVVFRHNVTFGYGTYAVATDDGGAERIVLRYDVSADRLTPNFLRDIVMAMVGEVQQLDSELSVAATTQPWRATPPSETR